VYGGTVIPPRVNTEVNRCGTKSRGHNRAGQGSIHLYLDWLSQSQSWSLEGQKAMGQSHFFAKITSVKEM
jgi:hypothetical protein